MKIVLVVPAYNEEKYIVKFLNKLSKQKPALSKISKILIVNDGSTDSTANLLKKASLNRKYLVLTHSVNKGKGEAMRTGLKWAQKHHQDAIIYMDSDLQHDPKHLGPFINALDKNNLVFGYRDPAKGTPFIRRAGNDFIRFIFRNFFSIRRRDLLCGFFGIRAELFQNLHWASNRYGVESEIAAIVGKKGIPFVEIKIDTIYLDPNKGVQLLDALKVILKIPFWYFKY